MQTTDSLLKQLQEKLTSFEDACKIETLDAEKIRQGLQVGFEHFPQADQEAMRNHAELVVIVKAANRIANGGNAWIPDYDDGNLKYEPWWELDGLGGSRGFRFGVFGAWLSASDVGSRLCFFNRTVGNYVTEVFAAHYEQWIVTKVAEEVSHG